ncbi:MAG: thioredoxin family protein [Marinilabiliales bacterium]|nr:MAG: thioredoxin family protein [Marinilabiliales bacterium]
MKTIFLILLTLSISVLYAQDAVDPDTALWHTDYQHIIAESQERDLPILMVFSGCDWCKPCIKLKNQILETEEFENWAETHTVCIVLNFPSSKKHALSKEQTEQNEALAERFNKCGIFPLVLILNSDEEILGNLGYEDISVAEYIAKIEEIINQ